MNWKPHLINFSKIGLSEIGYISVNENIENIPFKIKRVFWTYFTPEEVIRGRHAHHKTEQVLIAVAGVIIVNAEMPNGEKYKYVLDKPNIAVYIPPNCWHTMQFSHSSVLLVFANTKYNEKDYIRDYIKFKEIYTK